MSKDKIELWTPWEWKEMFHCFPDKEPQGTTIMSSGGHYVCHQFNIRPIAQRQELATAIVSAVNNTYGQEINPEAVIDLYKIAGYLIEISEYKSFSMSHFFPLFKAAKAAIEKTKL